MEEIKKGDHKFYIGETEENDIARITWVDKEDNVIVVNHTFVDPSLRGQGIAHKLLTRLVEYVRNNELKVIPTCSYAVKKLTRNDEYNDILFDQN